MKIMVLNRHVGTPITNPIATEIIPDSAIIKDGKPFFVPDFSSKWEYTPCFAVRINRLGKNIGERFASRYYDALALCLRIIPVDLKQQLSTNGIISATATSFDGAMILGDWIESNSLPNSLNLKIASLDINIDLKSLDIDKTISEMSKYFTFKIGDILIPASVDATIPFNLDDNIIATINNTLCLTFRPK